MRRAPLRPGGAWLAALVLLLLVTPTWAWTLDVKETTLSNGMEVMVVERDHVPLVACHLWVDAGAANEDLGATGIAHFHEHLMFKGTPKIGTSDYDAETGLMERQDELAEQINAELDRGDAADMERVAELRAELMALEDQQRDHVIPSHLDRLYSEAGASGLNAGTSYDYTMYTVTVPANKVELWMWLESDRFAGPVFREFYSERQVIGEERKQVLEDEPTGPYHELLDMVTFPESTYGQEIIGTMKDIGMLTRPEAYAFFGDYYVPNNMALVLVGDVDADEVFEMAETYFGRIPASDEPDPNRTRERHNVGERRVRVEAQAQPQVDIRYITTTFGSEDDAVLDVIAGILSGESGRLYKRLVLDEQIALAVDASSYTRKVSGSFDLSAVPAEPGGHAQVEAALTDELERLATEPVSDSELEKVKKQARADLMRAVRANDFLALMMGYYWVQTGDWRGLLDTVDEIAAVTADDVMEVADKYFDRDNRAVGWLVAEGVEDEEAAE
jgi:predicted Zn-dependent peptidase